MGGVITIPTRGMGERLTYGIPARYCVVPVERHDTEPEFHTFFDRGASVLETFAGHLGPHHGESLAVSLPLQVYLFVCETRSVGFK